MLLDRRRVPRCGMHDSYASVVGEAEWNAVVEEQLMRGQHDLSA